MFHKWDGVLWINASLFSLHTSTDHYGQVLCTSINQLCGSVLNNENKISWKICWVRLQQRHDRLKKKKKKNVGRVKAYKFYQFFHQNKKPFRFNSLIMIILWVHPQKWQASTVKPTESTLESVKPITDKRKQHKITEPTAMHIIVMKCEVFKRLIETLEHSYAIPEHSTISEALIGIHGNPQDQALTQKRSCTAVSFMQTFSSQCPFHYQRWETLEKTLDKHLESQVDTVLSATLHLTINR